MGGSCVAVVYWCRSRGGHITLTAVCTDAERKHKRFLMSIGVFFVVVGDRRTNVEKRTAALRRWSTFKSNDSEIRTMYAQKF